MQTAHLALFIVITTLIACNEEPLNGKANSSNAEDVKTQASNTTTIQKSDNKAPALDLSLPESLSEDIKTLSEHADKTSDDKKPILPNLFENQEKEKSLSISGKPTLSMGEEPGSIPEVTGGELDVKLKLP